MNVELRKSKPSEVHEAIPLIYSSGPAAFEFVFENNKYKAQDFLKYAFLRKHGEFSYDNHYSLYLNEEMVGIGSVFDASMSGRFTWYDGMKIIKFYKIGSPRILRNGLQIEQILKLPKGKEIVLAHLGITEEYRGKGLGTRLIKALMAKAKTQMGSRFVLDVSEENRRAKVLYEKLGFITTNKMLSNYKNKYSYLPNHFRMELNAESD